MVTSLIDWLSQIPTWAVAGLMLAAALGGGFVGRSLRLRSDRRGATGSGFASDGQEGYIVSGVLGLLALMMGFSLAMAVDRFDSRRGLVLEEAKAISTTYLRSQLLDEPHRARLSKLLVEYTDNRIVLATAKRDDVPKLLADNDRMLTDFWAATAAAFDSIADLDFSSSFLESASSVVENDVARKAARLARVPRAVFVLLSLYVVVTAGVLGYVLSGFRGRLAGGFLITLLTIALALIIDLDRPTSGSIRESQAPMELLRASLKAQPPEVFDRYRSVELPSENRP